MQPVDRRAADAVFEELDPIEDLAQETLVEAWRHVHKLRGHEGLRSWLSAIARNVCRCWLQRQGREVVYHALSDDDPLGYATDERLVDAGDPTLALERHGVGGLA